MDASLPPLTPSTLYLVATPIGNLEDITLRALRVLRECDVVAAEDTRRSGQLLKHFGLSKPLLSYFQFNEARRSEEIIERLRRGEKIALVTDAGSPGISDPGERVVRAAITAGFRVETVAGPCALVAALTASGLPTAEFHFLGFLPHKSGQRRNQLTALLTVPGTLVFYESPYRIEKLLGELNRGLSRTRRGAGPRIIQEIRGIPARQTGGPFGAGPETQFERRICGPGRPRRRSPARTGVIRTAKLLTRVKPRTTKLPIQTREQIGQQIEPVAGRSDPASGPPRGDGPTRHSRRRLWHRSRTRAPGLGGNPPCRLPWIGHRKNQPIACFGCFGECRKVVLSQRACFRLLP